MSQPSRDKFRQILRNIKESVQEGYVQGNHYRFEDILQEIGKLENDNSPLDFEG